MGVFILSQTFVPKITILRISIFTDITPPRINSTDTDFIIWNLKFIFNVSISQWCIHSPATSLGTTLCGCVCVCAIILVLCFRARVCYWASILCFHLEVMIALIHIACHLLPDCWTDPLVKVCLRMHCILPLLFALCLLYLRISLLCRNSGEKVGEIVWESENVNLPDCLGLVLTAWKPSALIPWIHLL